MHASFILRMAGKYIWWLSAEEAAERPERVVSQVMNIGDFEDVQEMTEKLGEEYLKEVLVNSEAGWLNERSWAYWHYRLGLAEPGHVPAMPQRKIS